MKTTKSSRRSRADIELEEEILTSTTIAGRTANSCKPGRNRAAPGHLLKCPNDLKCRELYLHVDGIDELLTFRKQFWVTDWRRTLLNLLINSSSKSSENGTVEFAFHIGARAVCKDFFRAATGLTRQIFGGRLYFAYI